MIQFPKLVCIKIDIIDKCRLYWWNFLLWSHQHEHEIEDEVECNWSCWDVGGGLI